MDRFRKKEGSRKREKEKATVKKSLILRTENIDQKVCNKMDSAEWLPETEECEIEVEYEDKGVKINIK